MNTAQQTITQIINEVGIAYAIERSGYDYEEIAALRAGQNITSFDMICFDQLLDQFQAKPPRDLNTVAYKIKTTLLCVQNGLNTVDQLMLETGYSMVCIRRYLRDLINNQEIKANFIGKHFIYSVCKPPLISKKKVTA